MEGGLQVLLALVNARCLQLQYAKVLYETLFGPVLIYGSDTMMWKVNESSRISPVHMDNFRGLLGIRRKDKVPNAWIRR